MYSLAFASRLPLQMMDQLLLQYHYYFQLFFLDF